MRHGNIAISWRRQGRLGSVLVLAAGLMVTGCARLPYTTKTVHEDERVVVTVQHEVELARTRIRLNSPPRIWPGVLRGFDS